MKIVYIIPVSLLHQAAEWLQPPERMCFVTGIKQFEGRVIVLTQLVDVVMTASRVHVAPNPGSLLSAHRRLLSMRLDIESQFHSHPGRIKEATHPSTIDIATARRWETGAPFIGAIFSEGGRFVRFFNHRQQSEVIIHGHYLETNEPNCFELSPTSGEALPALEGKSGRLVIDGSAGEDLLVEPKSNPGSASALGGLRRPR